MDKYIIALGKMPEGEYDAFVNNIISDKNKIIDTSKIAYTYGITPDRAKKFDTAGEAEEVADKIRTQYKDSWSRVEVNLVDEEGELHLDTTVGPKAKETVNNILKRKNESTEIKELDGVNVTNTFKNYPAFKNNFGEIKIIKNSYDKLFYVYKNDAENAKEYIQNSNSKDYIEGWLYGAVQAANNVITKSTQTNDLEESKELTPLKYSYSKDEIRNYLIGDLPSEEYREDWEVTDEEVDEKLSDIDHIESESEICVIHSMGTDDFHGFKEGKVRTYLTDGRVFQSTEEELSLWNAVECIVSELIEGKKVCETKEVPYDNTTPKKCPNCGNIYTQYPALSRRDNKTYICPDCGVEEAMFDFLTNK